MKSLILNPRNLKRFSLPLKILASILMLTWMISAIKWSEIVQVFHQIDPLWIVLALVWVILSVGVSAYKWQLILKASHLVIPLRVLWKNYWEGLFFNNFLPSSIGGDGLRIYRVGKLTGDIAGSTTSVVVERILATIGLCLTALIAASLTPLNIPYLLPAFLILMMAGILILVLCLFPQLAKELHKRLTRLAKVQIFLNGVVDHGNRLRKHPGLLFKALIVSVLFQICVVMVNWCLFRALSAIELNLIEAAVLIPATSVAAMLPVGINGYGVREGAYISLFAYVGITRSVALTASLLFALIVSFLSLWGGWIWVKEGRRDVGEKRVPNEDRKSSRSLFQ
jgi:uncharacterized protein (TIRG00374 family)